jgi:DDB1- and CUL4-associated factor 6
MPHSNDQKLVTCAGDNEVRIFDIERTSTTHQHLYRKETNCKTFLSHRDSVKRIVTEASPFYFLTCSEDGDVRQWDVRQDSSSYPRQRHSFRSLRTASSQTVEVPPPLISYGQYNVQLYTISCSPSQPHYIALGGSHVHCFLHDRRMMGRDPLQERGGRLPASLDSEAIEDRMMDATRCVAKFAPYGQPKMSERETKTITACKLGTACPNELIVSWTGDHIYSFNILKSQRDAHLGTYSQNNTAEKASGSSSRKRKRLINNVSPSAGPNLRPRRSSDNENASPELSLVARLRSGENLEIPIHSAGFPVPPNNEDAANSINSDPEAGTVYAHRVRSLKNCLMRSHFRHEPEDRNDELEAILFAANTAFEMIYNNFSNRTYPLTESAAVVDYQMKLRNDRAKVWRFAQASGVLARVLLGPNTTRGPDREAVLRFFNIIRPAPREGSQPLPRHEQFGYDFCKAVLLWLESGVGTVLREFSPESQYYTAGTRSRFPVSENAGIEALDSQLIPYLANLAIDRPVVYAGHGGAGDDPREGLELFASEKQLVRALALRMKRPFADLQSSVNTNGDTSADIDDSSSSTSGMLNRKDAIEFWGFKACMAVLSDASIDVNFPLVATAFEPPHRERNVESTSPEPRRRALRQRPNQEERLSSILAHWTSRSESTWVATDRESRSDGASDEQDSTGHGEADAGVHERASLLHSEERQRQVTVEDASSSNNSETGSMPLDEVVEYVQVALQDDSDGEDHDEVGEEEDLTPDEEGSSDEEISDHGDEEVRDSDVEYQVAPEEVIEFALSRANRSRSDDDSSDSESSNGYGDRIRSKIAAAKHVPCSTHVRSYEGHCNVQTTKDVNFYGLQDEYIVSGSDCGNFFIWEKKTGRLVNILHGDQEVVNVVQRKSILEHCDSPVLTSYSSSLRTHARRIGDRFHCQNLLTRPSSKTSCRQSTRNHCRRSVSIYIHWHRSTTYAAPYSKRAERPGREYRGLVRRGGAQGC